MTADFSTPQRQSPIGVVVMFFDTVREYVRGLWPLLVLWLLKFDTANRLYFFLGLAIFLGFIAVAAYLRYRKFTFYIDEEQDEFIITTGIFSKTRTAIRLDRIQQVNINQSLVQRIIGVYELEVDTAGSNSKEGKIRAVSHPLAIALKTRLLEERRDHVVENEDEPVVTSGAFIKISFLSLVKTGITSNYVRTVGILLAFFITMWDNFRQWNAVDESEDFRQLIDFDAIIQSTFALIVFFAIAVLVINLFRVIVKYFGFTINKQGSSLLLSFGLFNTKSTIIRPERVQITSVTRNFFQKKMDILQIRIKQAGGVADAEKSAIDIPGCNQSERDEILKLLYKSVPEPQITVRPDFRKLLLSVFLAIVLPLSIFFTVTWFRPEAADFIYLGVLYTISAGLLVWFGYKNNKLMLGDQYVVLQSGAWDVTKSIIDTGKVQAISISQYFWHKKLDIGSITLHTAGGNISFQLGNYTVIRQYVNRWLYKIESTNSNWM